MVNAVSTNSNSVIKIITTNKVAVFARKYWWAMIPLAFIGLGAGLYAVHYHQLKNNSKPISSSFQTALAGANINEIAEHLADTEQLTANITFTRQAGNEQLIHLYQAIQTLPQNKADVILQELSDTMVEGDNYEEYVIAMQYLDVSSFDAYFIGKCPLEKLKRAVKIEEFKNLIDAKLLADRITRRAYKNDAFTDDLALLLLLGQPAPNGIDATYQASAEAAIASS